MAQVENDHEKQLEELKSHIKTYPDFPKPGVIFSDIFSLLREPKAFRLLTKLVNNHVKTLPKLDCVVALDSRGFLFGTIIALEENIPFVPIRKKGKLPGDVLSTTYSLEYGQDTLELQKESISRGSKVLVVDDLVAVGGTLTAACKLLQLAEVEVVECLVIMELVELEGRKKVPAHLHSFLKF